MSSASEHLGAWWDTPEAALACRKLDAYLAPPASADPVAVASTRQTLVLPSSGVVQDLLHFSQERYETQGSAPLSHELVPCPVDELGFFVGLVLKRRTALVSGDGTVLTEQLQEWVEWDQSQSPDALLLTHHFPDAPWPGATLTLRTLYRNVQPGEVSHQTMLHDVFGRRTPALCTASPFVTTSCYRPPVTDVLIDGEPLSEAMLASLPTAQRKAVDAARRAQLLSTVRDCITQHWAGGFLALRHFVAELLGVSERLWTEPLAVRLLLGRTGGIATAESVSSQLYRAHALEAAGQYTKAAAVIRTCLRLDASRPPGELHPQPAALWYQLGLIEHKAGNCRAAVAAFRSALDAHLSGRPIDSGRRIFEDDDLRFRLLCSIVLAIFEMGEIPEAALLVQLFQQHAPCKSAIEQADQPILFEREAGSGILSAFVGGRIFSLIFTGNRWLIEELRPGARAPARPVASASVSNKHEACLPAMPPGRCAACLATSRTLKQCHACHFVLYCGAWLHACWAALLAAVADHLSTRLLRRRGVPASPLAGTQGGLPRGSFCWGWRGLNVLAAPSRRDVWRTQPPTDDAYHNGECQSTPPRQPSHLE